MTAVDMEQAHTSATFDNLGSPSRQVVAAEGKSRRFRLIVTAVALLGVVCVAVGAVLVFHQKNHNSSATLLAAAQATPAIKLTLQFKRESMYYYGQSSAVVYAFPRTSSSGANLGYDGVLELKQSTTIEKYVYVNDKAYYTKKEGNKTTAASCLMASQMPTFNVVDSTLHNAKVIDRATVGSTTLEATTDCPQGKLLSVAFGGEKFIVCTAGDDKVKHVTGQDMNVDVEYLSSLAGVPSLDVPKALDGSALNCQTTTPKSVATVETKSFSEFTTAFTETLLGTRQESLFGSDCQCKSRKPCLFVHGVFNFIEGGLTDTFPLYWGDVDQHNSFCNAALQVSGSSSRTVGPINLITHSMGNMITGAALATGKCSFSKDVTWISSAGPMKGSEAANLLAEKCLGGGLDVVISKPLEFLGFCPPTRAFASLYYQDSVNAATQKLLIAGQQARAKHPNKKVLCGNDGYGLNTIFSVPLQIVGGWADHNGPNDGVVAVESCVAGLGSDVVFGGDITSTNYKGPLNHEDLAFRNGDGWLGDDRKPVKWLSCAL
ncbi:hypothetical protein AC1031_005706 [Aphanomyces cochlioides]|nr:hypothetical protein AC1031_005706 [Aphanomyces cochlioides]